MPVDVPQAARGDVVSEPFVVWSFEHDAWWAPARCGYTPRLEEAGHYTHAEADQIVTKANRYAKQVQEQAFPLRVATTYAARGWHPLVQGAYDDGRGGLHLVVAEMLTGNGFADTPANRATLIAAARQLADGPVEVLD